MEKILGFIRKITVPPVFAAALLIIAYIADAGWFGGIWPLLASLVCLVALPSLAYPLQPLIPKYKDRGREGQRSLAMIFSFLGYVLGVILAFALPVAAEIKLVHLEYLVCGIIMIILNKGLKIKASGHACGIVGPVIMLVYLGLYIPAIVGAVIILPVFISSVVTKQHTPSQLIAGSLIPAIALAILLLLQPIIA